jgi:hypothetical protein
MMNEYVDGDFANPAAVCDVIMKGGITSGVVYPLALTELARQFPLSRVGGTSAGAIAAAAAAEYGSGALRMPSRPALQTDGPFKSALSGTAKFRYSKSVRNKQLLVASIVG